MQISNATLSNLLTSAPDCAFKEEEKCSGERGEEKGNCNLQRGNFHRVGKQIQVHC